MRFHLKSRLALLMLILLLAAGCSSQASPSVEPAEALDDAPAVEPASTSEEGQAPDESGAPEMDAKILVETRCVSCHDIGRVETAKKSADEWKANVERMVAKGAQLSAEEQAVVIEYLAKTYP